MSAPRVRRNGRLTAAALPRSESDTSRPPLGAQVSETSASEPTGEANQESTATLAPEETPRSVYEQLLDRITVLERQAEIRDRINTELLGAQATALRPKDNEIKPESVSIKLHPRSSLEQRQRWFGELEYIFGSAPRRYAVDFNKISTAYFCIDPVHRPQWTYYKDSNFLDRQPTWQEFKDWTLEFVRGGRSTEIDIAELYNAAEQRPNQDPLAFHNYLMSIESQMDLTEELRANGYFAKLLKPLRNELKFAFQANLPKNRQDLVEAAIRTWDTRNMGSVNPYPDSNKGKRSNDESIKPNDYKRQRNDDTRTKGTPSSRSTSQPFNRFNKPSPRDNPPNRDRAGNDSHGRQNPRLPDHSHLTCHACGKMGHISTNCPNNQSNPKTQNDTSATVNQITQEEEHPENYSESE
jgi:hypothetical protein